MKTYNTKKFFKFLWDHGKGWFLPLALGLLFLGAVIVQSTDIDYYFDNEYGTMIFTYVFLLGLTATAWLSTFYLYYRNQHGGYRLYKIKKGKHRSGFYFRPAFFRKGKTYKYKVIFDDSCIYTLPGMDQLDINKLKGISEELNHHKNSERLGWRAYPEKEEIELFSYRYDDSIRSHVKLGTVKPREEIEFYFTIKESFLGYHLFPFFGGNQTAPHDMYMFVKRV